MKIINDKTYTWMLNHLPRWVMYYNAFGKNDTNTKFWQPRWGYPKEWLDRAEERAEELLTDIIWEGDILWIVEKEPVGERLIKSLKEKNIDVFVVDELSNNDDLSRFEKFDGCIVFYGSLNLGMKLKEKFNWIPGVYGNVESYKCTNYYPLFGENHINSDYVCMTFGELLEKKNEILKNGPIFVRPDSILKEFSGTVVSSDNFDEKYKLMSFYDDVVTPDLPVIISSVKDIEKEWRFIIVDDKVISGTLYHVKGNDEILHEPCIDEEASKLVSGYARLFYNGKWLGGRVWVVDVCLSNLGYKVLEVGCFSFAEIYSDELSTIQHEVSKCAINQYNMK